MPVATEETGRAREMRLRRHAQSRGLVLRKARTPGPPGGRHPAAWSLALARTGEYLAGGQFGGKTLDEIERFINEGNWMP